MGLILASNSPRRKELLENEGYEFDVIASSYKENKFTSDPILLAETFAKSKASSVFDSVSINDKIIVLGADTVVYHNGEILGKPSNEEQARKMLKDLSGKEHDVITAYCLKNAREEICGHVLTKVLFNDLTGNIIDEYINSGLYKGKAGAYGIQDGFPLVKSYVGSYNNVVGLPTEVVFPLLEKMLKKENTY